MAGVRKRNAGVDGQLPLFVPECQWTPPNLDELPDWSEFKKVSVDTETRDEKLTEYGPGDRRPNSYIVGVSFSYYREKEILSHYLPIRHREGDNLDPNNTLRYIRDNAKKFKGTVYGANLQYDFAMLDSEEITFPEAKVFDIQIAEPLLDEYAFSYSLENLGMSYLGRGKLEEIFKEAISAYGLNGKNDLWKLPGRYVSTYAKGDVILPLEIGELQWEKIKSQNLQNVVNLENNLLPVLVYMHRRGVKINIDKVQQIIKWSMEQEKKALAEIKVRTGKALGIGDIRSSAIAADILLSIGIDVPRTKKPKRDGTFAYSVDKYLLESIDHPVADAMRIAKQMNTIRNTFCEPTLELQINGRIHGTFNQLRRDRSEDSDEGSSGAAFGRLSSQNPNLQNQPSPKRDEFLGKMWRAVYEPDDYCFWGSADYSQQEPRMVTHYAAANGLEGADIAAERYINDPDTDSHTLMAEITGLKRNDAKQIFLGLCYGMGGAKLCRKLGLSTMMKEIPNRKKKHDWEGDTITIEVAGPEGQAMLDQFNEYIPYLRELANMVKKKADRYGFVKTLSGRRCRFPRNAAGEFDWTYKALNRIIQGSSADQTKTAMIEAYRAGLPIQIQVHDELNGSFETLDQALQLKSIMENCIELVVPSRVDLDTGPNWGELTKVKI